MMIVDTLSSSSSSRQVATCSGAYICVRVQENEYKKMKVWRETLFNETGQCVYHKFFLIQHNITPLPLLLVQRTVSPLIGFGE